MTRIEFDIDEPFDRLSAARARKEKADESAVARAVYEEFLEAGTAATVTFSIDKGEWASFGRASRETFGTSASELLRALTSLDTTHPVLHGADPRPLEPTAEMIVRSVRLSMSARLGIEARARELGLSRSAYLREIVARFLAGGTVLPVGDVRTRAHRRVAFATWGEMRAAQDELRRIRDGIAELSREEGGDRGLRGIEERFDRLSNRFDGLAGIELIGGTTWPDENAGAAG